MSGRKLVLCQIARNFWWWKVEVEKSFSGKEVEFSSFERDLHDNFNVYQILHSLFTIHHLSFWHLIIISRQWPHSKMPQVTQPSFLLADKYISNNNNNNNFDPFTFLRVANYDLWVLVCPCFCSRIIEQ